jgi:hypothetical protein
MSQKETVVDPRNWTAEIVKSKVQERGYYNEQASQLQA